MPTASIVLTTCDRPAYLDESLQSLREQTYADLEILVCDDASDPRTAEVVSRHAAEDERVIHRRSAIRRGVVTNVLDGLGEAHGELVAICNDDDTWEPTFLAKTTAALQAHQEAVVVFSDHFIMDEAGQLDLQATDTNTRRWKRDTLPSGRHQPFRRLALIDQSVPMVMSALFRASALDLSDFPAQVGGHYDLWLAYLLTRTGGGAWYTPERLMRYRVHSQSASSKGGVALARSSVYIWERLIDDEQLADIRPELQMKLSRALASLGVRLLCEDHRKEARSAFLRAFAHKPGWHPATGWALSTLPTPAARHLATLRRPSRASANI
jgi:glycosyltransferase involved in cell wall biosynthesis